MGDARLNWVVWVWICSAPKNGAAHQVPTPRRSSAELSRITMTSLEPAEKSRSASVRSSLLIRRIVVGVTDQRRVERRLSANKIIEFMTAVVSRLSVEVDEPHVERQSGSFACVSGASHCRHDDHQCANGLTLRRRPDSTLSVMSLLWFFYNTNIASVSIVFTRAWQKAQGLFRSYILMLTQYMVFLFLQLNLINCLQTLTSSV